MTIAMTRTKSFRRCWWNETGKSRVLFSSRIQMKSSYSNQLLLG